MGKKHRRPIPGKADDVYRRAVVLHRSGRLAEAEALYRELPPGNADVLQLLGVICYQTGREDEGLQLLNRSLEIRPDHPEALSNLGVILHERRQYDAALSAFENALAKVPGNPDLLNKRGFVLQDLNRHEEAAATFRLALDSDPHFADAWLNLGNSLQLLGQFDGAASAFRKVLAMRPLDTDALANLGSVLVEMQQVNEAAEILQRAISIRPSGLAYHNLATALSAQGKRDEALRAAQTAVQLSPKTASHHRLLGLIHLAKKQTEASIAALRKSYEIDPLAATAISLAASLNNVGRYREALDFLYGIPNPSDGIRLGRSLLVPVIPMSVEEIEQGRQRVLDELEKLSGEPLRIPDPVNEVGMTNFYWSYHSDTELPMQRAVVEAYSKACPDLLWEAPHVSEPRERGAKIRLGVCSANLTKHTIGKLFRRLVAGLKADDIEVIFFDASHAPDEWTKEIVQSVDRAYRLSANYQASRQLIAEQRLDALFYPDIGMEQLTYYLAFSRLAGLQFMTWGHPVSTALPNMDCFLSSHDLEREGSAEDYSERLVRFENLMTVFTRPEPPTATRADLGLPEDKRLYVCPQTLFKLHPDFDRAFAEILRRDSDGLVVLITGLEKHWDDLLRQRFAQTMPDVADRILFIDKLSTENFIALNALADAVLDTFYFGGGNTSLEAFSAGTPIVTLPGKMLRGRITLTQYRKMGIADLVARDIDHYVELALRLAQDRAWHGELSQKILQNCHVLYDNVAAIAELQNFVRAEVAGR